MLGLLRQRDEAMAEANVITTTGLDVTLRALREQGSVIFKLAPTCHPKAGVDLYYHGGSIMRIQCHRCHGAVASLAVAAAWRREP